MNPPDHPVLRATAGRQQGLTLLEVVIAVAILAVGVLAAAGLQANGLRASRAAQQIQALNAEARSELDVWRVRLASETRTEPTSGTCMTGSQGCSVTLTPCLLVAGTLDCDRGTVSDPDAQSVTVQVTHADRSVTLRSVVYGSGS